MFRSILRFSVLALLPCLAPSVRAAEWESSSFRGALAESELVVVAEVIEAQPLASHVRVIDALKGNPPQGDFILTGFNDPCWSAKDRQRHTLRAKERYLLLLKQNRASSANHEPTHFASSCLAEPTPPKTWRGLSRYAVPSTSLGTYLIERARVYSDWRFCADCADTLAAPSAVVLPILKGLTQPGELTALAAAREVLSHELTPDLVRSAQSDGAARVKLAWLLEGQYKFGSRSTEEAVLAATSLEIPELRSAALRALPSLGPGPSVFRVLDGVLKARDVGGEMHARAALALTWLDPQGNTSTDPILAAIAAADASESVARETPIPGLGPWTSARETMVRALTQFRAKRAEPALVDLLRRADNQPGTFDALLTHFFEFPSASARAEFIRLYGETTPASRRGIDRFFIDTDDEEALAVILQTSIRRAPLPEVYALLKSYALHRAPGSARLEQAVRRLLDARRGDRELALLMPLALAVRDANLIRLLLDLDSSQRLDSDPKTAERIARAILLRRSPQHDAKGQMREWLQLLIDDRWSREATPFLLRECVCTTPAPLLSLLGAQLELEGLPSLAQQLETPTSGVHALHRDADFNCVLQPAREQTAPVATANKPLPIAPVRSGCGASCALCPAARASSQFLGFLVAFAMLRRRARKDSHRHVRRSA